ELREVKGPVVFPVMGRGRVMEALYGNTLAEKNVQEAAARMAGPCSCIIKFSKPGHDLVLCAAWGAVTAESQETESNAFGAPPIHPSVAPAKNPAYARVDKP